MMNEFDTKKPWQSVGVWGGVIALLAPLLGVWDLSMSAEDASTLPVLITSLISALGGLAAIFGRVRASKRIG